jgi:cell division protein FtsW (lipid II flippase)
MFTHEKLIAVGLSCAVAAGFALDWRAGCIVVILAGFFTAMFSAMSADFERFDARYRRNNHRGDQ